MHRLSEEGYRTYSRGGVVTGIKCERKYTFRGLGLATESLKELDGRSETLRGIQIFRDKEDHKQKDRERELEKDDESDMGRDMTDRGDPDYIKGKEVEVETDQEVDHTEDMEPDLEIER